FLAGEVKLLGDYLNGGGRLLLFLDPTIESGFGDLLESWGLALDGRIVIDASLASQLVGLQPDMPVATQYGNHPITSTFQEGISFYPSVQAIATEEKAGLTAANLVETSDQSWSETDPTEDPLQFNPDIDARGPLALGVVVTKDIAGGASGADAADAPPAAEESTSEASAPDEAAEEAEDTEASADDDTPDEGRLIVFGTSTFVADGLFNQQLNGDVFLNSVGWLSDRDESTLALRPREPSDRRLLITEFEGNLLRLFALAILPLGALGFSGWLWWRSR
ncbi:MAG: ABC transporter, partial [Cyanobacteria bacterium P01_H01_bin.130]